MYASGLLHTAACLFPTSTKPGSQRTEIAPSFPTPTIGDLWDRSTEANTRVTTTYGMVSRAGIFALSTTSGQGLDTCIERVTSALWKLLSQNRDAACIEWA